MRISWKLWNRWWLSWNRSIGLIKESILFITIAIITKVCRITCLTLPTLIKLWVKSVINEKCMRIKRNGNKYQINQDYLAKISRRESVRWENQHFQYQNLNLNLKIWLIQLSIIVNQFLYLNHSSIVSITIIIINIKTIISRK